MKSTEFITEGLKKQLTQMARQYKIDDPEVLQVMKVIVTIGQECRPYLNQVSNPLGLFRGVDGGGKAIKKRIRLDDREPQGMSRRTQSKVNRAFTDKFGAPFRNSMLCTGDENEAEAFGNLYSVFPIGDFKFLWSPEIYDLNNILWNIEEEQGDVIELDDIIKIVNDGNYKTSDLEDAINSRNEIMIRGQGYYGIEHYISEFGLPDRAILKLLKIGMQK